MLKQKYKSLWVKSPSINNDSVKYLPSIIIIGGGFAGIAAAKALSKTKSKIFVIDKQNHHTFQPLLYQVATAVLSPANIASPIRNILQKYRNCNVVLGEVKSIDLTKQIVFLKHCTIEYDWLIVAAGATHSYFNHPEWEELAPGLKSLEDATKIRRRILLAFESAEYEKNENQKKAALTFAIIGGGATGVELAGAIKEIAAKSLPADFRNIDTTTTRIILIQGEQRLLPQFSPKLSERAKKDLEEMGVEVITGKFVTDITKNGIFIGKEFLPVKNVFWAAGVKGNPLANSLMSPLDKTNRVIVQSDLSIPGHSQVFVIGDMASTVSAKDGKRVPGVAQSAIQMGKYVARIISKEISCKKTGECSEKVKRIPFSYYDKGSMATIGRARAIVEYKGFNFTGLLAWLMWGIVHILFLVTFRNRIAVFSSWIWHYVSFASGARIITGENDICLESEFDIYDSSFSNKI